MITSLRHVFVESWLGRAIVIAVFVAFIGWGVGDVVGYIGTSSNVVVQVGKTDITLTHSWVSAASDNSITYEIIFTPRIDGLKYLYLYLIPMKADNDIQ